MSRLLLAAVLAAAATASAAPPRPEALPPALRDWMKWVLHETPDAACPFLHGTEVKECAWPGRLTLSLDERGGRFTQSITVYREAWLALPGDARRWPQNVLVDGRPAAVVPSNGEGAGAPVSGAPSVRLLEGEHAVSGEFLWDTLPEALGIPNATGLLSLTVQGKAIALPNRDASGRVFLQKEQTAGESELLDITVHRLVTDEIPLTLTTRLTLKVSGKSREVVLSRALPDGFVPMSFSSPLPVRLEPDGRLRVQARPGAWVLELAARGEGPVATLSRPKLDGPWAADEVWVFDGRPSLRQVLVEGVSALDPTQTTLSDDWKRYPAYAMGEADAMKLTERRRGDSDPAPDRLDLSRTFWLDFDGQGMTVSDRISGQLNRSWRLEVQPGTELGRVVAAGADQAITRLSKDAPSGVELRQGRLALEADSRIPGAARRVPAVSWDADFNKVSATLQLPPGWRLIAASGADKVPATWFQQWTLLDLFLVLVLAAAMGRLFGVPFGVLALVALGLSWQESAVPQYAWLAALVGEALVRVLPDNWVRTTLKLYRLAVWLVLVIMLVAFSVQHIREGMYPALAKSRSLASMKSWSEYSTDNAAQYERSYGGDASGFAESEPAQDDAQPEGGLLDELDALDQTMQKASPLSRSASRAPPPQKKLGAFKQQRSFNVKDYDKNAFVQTGPGLPRWEWSQISIGFSGPVQRGQTLSLWLLGPTTNLVLAFLRVLLLSLLLLCVLGFPGGFWPEALKARFRPKPDAPKPPPATAAKGAVPALLAVLLLATPSAWAQPLPSKEVLEELKQRLLEPPACAPSCASSPRMLLEATPTVLRLRQEVLAAAATAVPLPGNAQQWVPETVLLDGRPASALLRRADGSLWLSVPEGAHQVVLEGPLPTRDTVQVALPLKAHRVEAKLDGWTLDGLHEDGLADDDLQLSRQSAGEKGQGDSLQTGTLPPFVRVERTLVLGLQWTVDTRVVRLTPGGTAIVLEVPLLPGESVTSSEVRVQGGKALVNMPGQAQEVSWTSALEAKAPIELKAPTGLPWVELWRLDVSPVWHVQLSGIPVVHQQDSSGARLPEWRPWPGEAVKIEVVKPESVQGQTLTIDQSRLEFSPGVRATDGTFTANMRASRGGLHAFTLPEGALLQSVVINGVEQPIRQEGRTVSIPLVPGSQNVALAFRIDQGITANWRTPVLSVGTPTVNAELQVKVPSDRWVLLLTGPRMGPAVLFWSFLLVLLIVSIGLSRTKLTPLKTWHWVLLALGLSQVPIPAIVFVFGWLLLLGLRKQRPQWTTNAGLFDLGQLALFGVTLVALGVLAASVYEGLLGTPSMQVQGNGSSATLAKWFVDRTTDAAPEARILSAPMIVYRGAMLLWSLWMAFALLSWLKWGWQAFSEGGLWRVSPKPAPRAPGGPPPLPAAPKAEPPKPQ